MTPNFALDKSRQKHDSNLGHKSEVRILGSGLIRSRQLFPQPPCYRKGIDGRWHGFDAFDRIPTNRPDLNRNTISPFIVLTQEIRYE